MDIINQTNRTILFEEINPGQDDLLTLLSDEKGTASLGDDKVREINEKLLVHNYEEFVAKFQPVIYEVLEVGKKRVSCFIKRPLGIPEMYIREIKLDKGNEFLAMFFSLVDTQKKSREMQSRYGFEHILDYMSPGAERKEWEEKRDQVIGGFFQYVKGADGGTKAVQLDQIRALVDLMTGQDHNIIALLPIAMANIKAALCPSRAGQQSYDPIIAGVLNMEEKEVHILGSPEIEGIPVNALSKEGTISLKEMVAESMDRNGMPQDQWVREVFYHSFGFSNSQISPSIGELVDQYNFYLGFYKQAKEEFITTAKPLIEKLLGIRLFFEQYQTKEKGMGMSLLVSNVKNSKWFRPAQARRLDSYLATVNTKTAYDNTIWFAILPSVPSKEAEQVDIRRERVKGNDKVEKGQEDQIGTMAFLMGIVARYKIHSFFSFEPRVETTFPYVSKEGIKIFIGASKPFMKKDFSPYVVPCLPNFTLVPEGHSYIQMGHGLQLLNSKIEPAPDPKEDKIWMGGIYVEACYVGAGLISAFQCPQYLKGVFGALASEDFPGVHYDIEEDGHREHTTTTLAKETTGFSKKVLAEIAKEKFGLVFSVGKTPFAIVANARTLAVRGDHYGELYKSLVMVYIERILQSETNDFKKDRILKFFANDPHNRRGRWMGGNRYVNPILGQGDSLKYHIEEAKGLCILEFTFKGEQVEMEIEMGQIKDNPEEGGVGTNGPEII